MRVCLVNPPFVFAEQDKQFTGVLTPDCGTNTFPIGLAILTNIVREHGHEVYVVEMPYFTEKASVDAIVAGRPDVVAFSCWTGTHRILLSVASQVKAACKRCRIVFGAHHVTLFSRQIMQNYEFVDGAVLGEGEVSFPHLLECWDGGSTPSLPGITVRSAKDIISTGAPIRLRDLDRYSTPAYDLFQLAVNNGSEVKYGAKHAPANSKRAVVLAARGCPFQCTFCVDGKFYTQTVTRDPVAVVDEMEYLYKNLSVNLFEFNDMTFTLAPKRTEKLCNEIIRRGLDVSWQVMTRVNSVSDELLKLMKAAGCYSVSFGVETGSVELLEKLKKKITREEIIEAFSLAHRNGLSTAMLLMVGNPGETSGTINETIDLLYETRPAQIDPNIYQVYPGSSTYAKLKADGWINDDYWLSHDAAPYFTGEHSLQRLISWQESIQMHHAYYVRDYLDISRLFRRVLERFRS